MSGAALGWDPRDALLGVTPAHWEAFSPAPGLTPTRALGSARVPSVPHVADGRWLPRLAAGSEQNMLFQVS